MKTFSFSQMKTKVAIPLLLITTFFWGTTFTIVKEAVALIDVYLFLTQRFCLAFLLLAVFCLVGRRPLSLKVLQDGAQLGALLFAAFAFQTVALQYTSASNTAFLTGLNVVLVPLCGALFFGQSVPGSVIAGVCVAVAGLFFLCTGGRWQFNYGDILAAICAVCVALHLLLTGLYSRRGGSDVYWLTTVQIGTVALLSCAAAFWRHQPLLQIHPATIGALIICALFATVFAFLVQTSMQRFISPAHTALIFCAEPVFAALYAYWAADERLGMSGVFGALLILAGTLLAELWPARADAELDLPDCTIQEAQQNATSRSSLL